MNDQLQVGFVKLFEVPANVSALSEQVRTAFRELSDKIEQLNQDIRLLKSQIPPVILRRGAAAKYLGVSQRTVDRMIKNGTMPIIKEGKVILCDVTNLRPVDLQKVSKRVVLGE